MILFLHWTRIMHYCTKKTQSKLISFFLHITDFKTLTVKWYNIVVVFDPRSHSNVLIKYWCNGKLLQTNWASCFQINLKLNRTRAHLFKCLEISFHILNIFYQIRRTCYNTFGFLQLPTLTQELIKHNNVYWISGEPGTKRMWNFHVRVYT